MIEMFKSIFGLFSSDSTVVKLGMYITILGMLGGGVVWAYNSIYDAGYSKAQVEYLKAADEAQAALEAEYKVKLEAFKDRLDKVSDKQKEAKELAEHLQEELTNRPVIEVYKTIYETVKSDCTFTPDDGYNKLRKQLIGEAPVIPSISQRNRNSD